MSPRPGQTTKPSLAFLAAALLLLVFSAGCSHLSARHLERKPWLADSRQELSSRFWNFSFQGMLLEDGYGVRGEAAPTTQGIPEWADWIEELWFEAYLCDSQGRVIARDIRVIPPRPLAQSNPIAFEFLLKPEELARPGPLYVAFGYRMVLAHPPSSGEKPAEAGNGEAPESFFVTEKALLRF